MSVWVTEKMAGHCGARLSGVSLSNATNSDLEKEFYEINQQNINFSNELHNLQQNNELLQSKLHSAGISTKQLRQIEKGTQTIISKDMKKM
mgnify:CR=1 FL=1